MKKSLIALAALAAVGAASAQSSVTLYGRLDLGTSYKKTDTTAAGVGGATTTTKTTSLAGAQGTRTGGRLGVRGSEDLGGGLKVNFNVETKVDPDATASTFGTTRTGILQLQGAFGSVTIGTYLNVLDDVRGYGVATAGVAGGDFLGGTVHTAARGGIGGRSQNSIGYRSPVFAGGFQAMIGTTYERKNTGAVATSTKTSGYLGGLSYNNGPVSAMLAGGQGKSVDGVTTNAKATDWAFAASYNLGMAVPYFQYENSKATDNLVAGKQNKAHSWELGSKFPMGAFTPYVTVSSGKAKSTASAGGTVVDTKIRGYQLGTTYDLSKRTYVYAAVGRDKSTDTSSVAASNGAATKNRGYALGLVHNF